MSTVGPLQWGATFAAVQAEGAALGSDWFAWERDGEAPPSLDGNGFAVDFADDLRLLRQFGATTVRLTFDWSRVEGEQGKVDGAVLDRYREVLAAAGAAGLDVIGVLADGPLPGWFSVDERGWRDRRARTYYWPRHVERIGDALGDLVAGWIPIIRPVSFARASFVTATAPPGTRSVQRFVETVQGAYLASVEAWRVLRGAHPVALGVEGAPVRQGEAGAERPTKLYDALQWAWVDGVRDGELLLPRMVPLTIDAMRDAFDALALTFDGGYAVGADGRVARYRQDEELLATLHRLAEHAGDRPVWLAGHTASQGDPKADAEAVEIALHDVDTARSDGIDVRRWYWEPAIDGYEFGAGFSATLGLFDRNRVAKPAAEHLRDNRRPPEPTAEDEPDGDQRGDTAPADAPA
ncbi:MAG: family 1 glycosylhydrolase [Acidimicrobiales bacterium]|nr:family 1 glycosylhydrolase [Acidimicrobiales bacterium]